MFVCIVCMYVNDVCVIVYVCSCVCMYGQDKLNVFVKALLSSFY
jgi:hypothetical protein